MRRAVALFSWCMLVWVLLTWTATPWQLGFGAGVAVAIAIGLAPRDPVAGLWRLLHPRVAVTLLAMLAYTAYSILVANVRLAVRIWRPSRPVPSGMVVVPTRLRTDGGLTAVGLLCSLIVENQLVDVDRARGEMQFHAVEVPDSREQAYESINGPIERLLTRWERP